MRVPRIGQGYDVHRLTEGRPLILGGVAIPWEKGLLGHSDADVLLHALMDALLALCATQPEMLDGLVEVIPTAGETLRFSEVRQFRPPYLKALGDISQFLQDSGYEAASKFLDCSFEL